MAVDAGFSAVDSTLIATAISELARNIVSYARKGEIVLQSLKDSRRKGVLIIASDNGPGIPDLRLALRDGFSTSGSLGLGLPGVKRLVDEFQIASSIGQGTVVKVTKWRQEQQEK
jgi:serine/threonine-protein kinase RsbT